MIKTTDKNGIALGAISIITCGYQAMIDVTHDARQVLGEPVGNPEANLHAAAMQLIEHVLAWGPESQEFILKIKRDMEAIR